MIFNIFNKRQIQLNELGMKVEFQLPARKSTGLFLYWEIICGNQGINFYHAESHCEFGMTSFVAYWQQNKILMPTQSRCVFDNPDRSLISYILLMEQRKIVIYVWYIPEPRCFNRSLVDCGIKPILVHCGTLGRLKFKSNNKVVFLKTKNVDSFMVISRDRPQSCNWIQRDGQCFSCI